MPNDGTSLLLTVGTTLAMVAIIWGSPSARQTWHKLTHRKG